MQSSQAPGLATSRPASVVLLTDCLEKPSLDDREYRVVRLKNELEALLVHDPQTDKASAALDVNVGNFSDEDDMPGMAHAVEHLLFMGTKKFPSENDYTQYLSANSGGSNAYTDATSTNYFFDVAAKPAKDEEPSESNPSPLYGALDRFSQFFIEPLFLSNTLQKELEVINDENNKNLRSDPWRLQQLVKSFANPKHPYCHFVTGNTEVLRTIPEAKGINIRDKIVEFYDRHYSANRMKLVVLGRESLDLLQRWVVELFSGVENKNLAPQRWTHQELYLEADLGTQCFAKPVLESRSMSLLFPFIDEEKLYETQPSRYISHLVGHEGAGSIMSYVKNKGWVDSIYAGASSVCSGTSGIFEVQVGLTQEGLANYPEIVKVFFQYVSMLREFPPQEWIFEEQKVMADVNFKFAQKSRASDFTKSISSVMQIPLPRELLLSGQPRLRTFDASLISKALETLRPDNMRLLIVDKEFPGNWDKTEKWYGTEYRYEKIPATLMKELSKAFELPPNQRLAELHLPHKNNFIPSKPEAEKKEVPQPALAPTVLRNDQAARTWWKRDDTFCVPKTNVFVSLQTPLGNASAESNVMATLFMSLVQDSLEEYSYDAELAGLKYVASLNDRGLFIKVSGYTEKLPVLLERVIITMRDIDIKAERFHVVHDQVSRFLKSIHYQSPYRQIGDYLNWLNNPCCSCEEAAAELQHVTADDVRLFQRQILSQLYIEVYAHGNISRGDALKVTDMVESALNPRLLPQSQLPIIRSLLLPRGCNYVFKKKLKDLQNVNHCIETWVYVDERSNRELRAKTLLIEQMIKEPAFDQLRTQEQLGYIVFTDMLSFSTTFGLRFLIQSAKTPTYLDKRIEAFLVQFGQKLENMTDSEFESHKRSLTMNRLEKLRNLNQESARDWRQITSEYYDFELGQRDAACIKPLTKAEMIEFYLTYFHPSSTTRSRISVQLEALGLDTMVHDLLKDLDINDSPYEERQSQELLRSYLEKEMTLNPKVIDDVISKAGKYGLPEAIETEATNGSTKDTTAVDTAKEILDIRSFRTGLSASSGIRPVKRISEFGECKAK